MKKKVIQKLSNETGVEFDGGDVILYDTRAYSPKRVLTLTYDEMCKLVTLHTDGCCPVCFEEIPMGSIICDECLSDARTYRRLTINHPL